MEIGPVDPAAVVSWMTSQAVAAGAALAIYLADRAATVTGYNLVSGSQKDIHAPDLRLLKGHAGCLHPAVAEIHHQANLVRAIGVHGAHIADGPQHERDQHAQKAESLFVHAHRLLHKCYQGASPPPSEGGLATKSGRGLS